MAELPSASAGAPAVASDLENLPAALYAASGSPGATKRSAAEAFEGDSVEDLKDDETTLDDVLVSPVTKKSKLLDEELPDVDDNEQFPQQEEDMDADLALGLENADSNQDMDPESLNMESSNQDMDNGSLHMENTDRDAEELAPPDEEEEEEEDEELQDSEPPTSQNNEIDIVDVDDDDDEESGPGEYQQQQYSGQDEEEEEEDDDDDEEETARAIARAQNQREARQLLMQLDDSARSKLCLTALEKYGEELFYGHEDARDAILVDACAQDSVLSLMRDAIRVRDLYLRGSAAAPVELDDDEEEEEEEEETGGYEDEEEEADDEEEKPAASNEDGDDDDVVVISEEDEEEDDEQEQAGNAAPTAALSPGNEAQTGANAEESSGSDGEEKAQSASGEDENDASESDEEAKETEAEALGDVGAAGDAAPQAPVADATT